MSVGAVGNAILFFFSLAGAIGIAAYFLAYAAHCLLVVVQSTAAGMDAVTWPDEPVFDWLLRSLHVIALGLILLAPAGIAARALHHGQDLQTFVLLALPLFWLAFPVCLLSALSGTSRWVLLRWRIVRALPRLLPAMVVFYLASALLLAIVVVTWLKMLVDQPYLLPVACVVTGAAILIYGRLLGRIGWLIIRLESAPAPRPASSKPRPAGVPRKRPGPRRRKGPTRAVEVEDPWAVPEAEPEPERPAKPRPSYLPPPLHKMEGYGMTDADAPRAGPRPRPRGRFEPSSPYEVEGYQLGPEPPVQPPERALGSDPAGLPPAPQATPAEGQSAQPVGAGMISEYEKMLMEPPAPPYVPARPLFTGVWTFPAYPGCQAAWFRLGVYCLLLGLMLLSLASHFGGLGV